jgi:uncharacterized membrane protein YfcA
MVALSPLRDLALFASGIVVGGINSVAGGGMLLGFPVLAAFGLPALVANATGKLVVLPGQVASALGYRAFWRTVPRHYYLLLIPTVLGGALGALLLRNTASAQFAHAVPFLILGAVGIFAFQPLLPRLLDRAAHHFILPFAALALGIAAIATYGGYFGVGFGFMLLSLLSFGGMESIHEMNVLKNIAGSVSLVVVVAILLPGSFIDWEPGLVMAAGTALGGYATARLAPRIPTAVIRGTVIMLGLVSAAYFFAYHPI